MRNASYVLAIIAVVMMLGAAFVWTQILRRPDEIPPTKKNHRRSDRAAKALVAAVVISALGAIVAVTGWFQR